MLAMASPFAQTVVSYVEKTFHLFQQRTRPAVPHTTYDRRRYHESHSSRPRPGLSRPSIPTILTQPGQLLPSRYPIQVERSLGERTVTPPNHKLTESTRWINGKSEQACRSRRVTNTTTITPPIGVSSPVLPCGCGGRARVAPGLVPERG